MMVKDEKNGGAIPVPDYTDINVSDKVVKIIQSYVGVVNKRLFLTKTLMIYSIVPLVGQSLFGNSIE